VRARTPQVEIERAAVEITGPVVTVRLQRRDADAVDQGWRRTVHASRHAAEGRTMAGDVVLESAIGGERPGPHVEVAAEIDACDDAERVLHGIQREVRDVEAEHMRPTMVRRETQPVAVLEHLVRVAPAVTRLLDADDHVAIEASRLRHETAGADA